MIAAGGSTHLPDPRLLLSGPVVFDTMALTFIARVRRTQLLRSAFDGRIMVPPFVMNEVRNWATKEVDLRDLLKPTSCMRVLDLSREEKQRVFVRQRAWHGAAAVEADYKKDRGEAECLELCKSKGWPLVSHDHKARENGPAQGTPVLTVVDILLVCVKQGLLKPPRAWTVYEEMCRKPVAMRQCRDWPLNAESRTRFLTMASDLLSQA